MLGLEVAGVVASVGPGSDAEGGWAVGERVMALVSGGGENHVSCVHIMTIR